MKFSYPLGLIGLVAIPVIILIYVLQSKYTEQTVSSTYLWNLSDKFLKKKNPLSGLTGIISLVLQILTVAAVSLALAHPIITIPSSAYEYCFVLDTSSSMSMREGKETRLELAKDSIRDVIKHARGGSTFTLLTVDDDTVFVFSDVKDKKTALNILEDVVPSDTASDTSDLTLAAQDAFDANNSLHIYVVTDKSFSKCENAEVISVGSPGENLGIFNLSHSHTGMRLSVSAEAVSYVSDRTATVILEVDGKEYARTSVSLTRGEMTPVMLECSIDVYDSITLSILENDGYMLDNSVTSYNHKSEDAIYSTLIVSEREFFLKAVIDALSDSEITVVRPEQYENVSEKYGLYIFDSFTPDALPDGAVWLINSDKSLPDSGFGVKGVVELPREDVIEKSKGTATSVRRMLSGVDGSNIYVTRYVKYSGMYLNFSTLFTYDSNPLIFAGTNGLGNRQVVFGFDFHDSDFPLTADFIILLGNLLEYTFPEPVDSSLYTVGDEVVINILPSADGYRAESPSGKDIYIDTDTSVCSVLLNEVGTYNVTVTLAGAEVTYSIYSSADPAESVPCEEEASFVISGEYVSSDADGEYDTLVLLFVIMTILFVADWGVYCYEKYQLR